MNLILQAVKVLFRGLENRLNASIYRLTKKVTTVEYTAKRAQTVANNAQNTANKVVDNTSSTIRVSVSGCTATAINPPKLINGKIYTVLPTSSAPGGSAGGGAAKIVVNGTTFPVYAGVNTKGVYDYGSDAVSGWKAFNRNSPLVVVFVSKTNAFYSLREVNMLPLPNSPSVLEDTLNPTHVYVKNGTNTNLYPYMQVPSSTPGSTKKFCIKVDDSGTITAVEVAN